MGYRRAILLVFVPFATGYYLSYLFRTINAVIAGRLTTDLALGAAQLGLLTSGYFLVCGRTVAHRHAARSLWSASGSGCLAVDCGDRCCAIRDRGDFCMLVLARVLIGLGVAAALPAGFKALVLWFPNERLPMANGCMIMLGALGQSPLPRLPRCCLMRSAGVPYFACSPR